MAAQSAFLGSPGDSDGKDSIRLQCGRPAYNPWVRKIPWRRKQQPTPVPLPGETPQTEAPTVHGVTKSQTRLKQLNAEAVLCHPDIRLIREGSVLGAIREGSRAQGPQSLLPAAAPCRSCYWGPAGAGVWRAPCRVSALPSPAHGQR